MRKLFTKISIWLLIICTLLAYAAPVYAQDRETEPTLRAATVTAEAGTTVDVAIEMYNNPGIVSMQLDIEYDPAVLTLEKVTDGGLIGSAVHSNNMKLCPYRLTWANDLAMENYTDNGIIATLTFAVSESALDGEYPIVITYTPNNFEIFDCEANEVDFALIAGSVTIGKEQCDHAEKTETPAKEADCENPGNNLYYTCNSCGLVLKADGITETTVADETLPALDHDMAAATCTEAAKCKRDGCEYTVGTALGHSFLNYVYNGDATCTVDGTKTAKCEKCEETDTKADEAHTATGHDMQKTSEEVAATCEAPGKTAVYTCANGCGKTEGGEEIGVLGHDMVGAKCQRDGCDYTEVATNVGTLENPEILIPGNERTVEVKGNDNSYYFQWTAPEDGVLTMDISVFRTLARVHSNGLDHDNNDTADKYYMTTSSPSANTIIWEVAKDETVFFELYTPTSYSGTGSIKIDFEAKEHSEGSNTKPIEIVDQNKDTVSVAEFTVTIPAGQKYWFDVSNVKNSYLKAEDSDGILYTTYDYIWDADENGVVSILIEQLSGSLEIENTTGSDFTTQLRFEYELGWHKNPVSLELGDTQLSWAVPNNYGRYYTWTAPSDGTFTFHIAGESEYNLWQYRISSQDEAGILHTAEDVPCVDTETWEVKAGDQLTIFVIAYAYAPDLIVGFPGVFNITTSFEEAECPHTEQITLDYVAPDCTNTGLTEGKKCSSCGEILVAQNIIPTSDAHDMKLTAAEVAPGCETTGKTAVYTCANGCGKTEGGEVIGALSHDYKSVVTTPTCTDGGYTTYTCTVCGDTYTDDETDIVDHNFKAGSCTMCGLIGGYCGVSTNAGGEKSVVWTLADGVLTISGNGAMANYVYDKAPWYSYVQQINTAVIEDGVTSIGNYAFYHCVQMTSVTISESVTNIGSEAFRDCSGLTSVTIPNSVTTIGDWAFGFCTGLTSVTIPDSITCLELSVFRECTSLTAVTIPNSVTTIGNCAFENCTSLSDITIPDSVTTIGSTAFHGCTSLTDVTIPNSVTTIGSTAFDGCTSLISVTIPDSVTSLGAYVFNNCTSLTSVTIGNSVPSIDDYAFNRCKSLTNITIPNSVTRIGRNAFSNCTGLTNVTIPEGVTSIGLSAFASCSNLTSVVIPESLTGHATDMFSGCTSLTDVYYGGTAQKWAIYNFNVSPAEYIHYEITDPTDHWVEAFKNATCEEDGYTRTECFCGYVRKETVTSATGHDMQKTSEEVAATCEAPGKTAVYTCANNCGKTEGGEKIDAKGHDMQKTADEVAPGCETAGKTAVYTCANGCGKTEGGEKIDAKGHDMQKTADEVAPGCETPGKTAVYTCANNCGKTEGGEEIDALSHKEKTDVAVEPTCTTTGLTEGKHCERCGSTLVAQEVIPALDHTKVTDEAVAPTCKTTGLTEGSHCSVCEAILVPQTIVDKLPHTKEAVPSVEPDCVNTGLTEGAKCSVCGDTLTAQEIIPALGHTEEALAPVDPTCTATGLTEGAKCSVCGTTLTAQEVISALGHTPETVPGYDATCTESGLTDGEKCSVCGTLTVEQVTIPAAGHAWESGICTECGEECEHNYDVEGGECTICGGNCAHDYETEVTAPTCTAQGYTTYTCGICGSSYKGDYKSALGHSWKDATCTAPQTCSVCGITEGEPNGHNYVSEVTAPTCTAQGYTTHSCHCGHSYTDSYTEPTGHIPGTPVEEDRVDPTCAEKGSYDTVVYCAVCDSELSREQESIPALGHTEGEIVTENWKDADCINTGSYDEVVYCAVCDAELSRETTILPVNGKHKEENTTTVPGKAPTCTAPGLSEGWMCTACGEILIAQEEISAKGHTPGEAVLEKNGDGWDEVIYCTVCEEELSRETVGGLLGDANCDGEVDNIDAMLIARYDVGLTSAEQIHIAVCDVNGDGDVDNIDAMLVARYDVGLETKYPIGQEIAG